jgi:hypothetical protein
VIAAGDVIDTQTMTDEPARCDSGWNKSPFFNRFFYSGGIFSP